VEPVTVEPVTVEPVTVEPVTVDLTPVQEQIEVEAVGDEGETYDAYGAPVDVSSDDEGAVAVDAPGAFLPPPAPFNPFIPQAADAATEDSDEIAAAVEAHVDTDATPEPEMESLAIQAETFDVAAEAEAILVDAAEDNEQIAADHQYDAEAPETSGHERLLAQARAATVDSEAAVEEARLHHKECLNHLEALGEAVEVADDAVRSATLETEERREYASAAKTVLTEIRVEYLDADAARAAAEAALREAQRAFDEATVHAVEVHERVEAAEAQVMEGSQALTQALQALREATRERASVRGEHGRAEAEVEDALTAVEQCEQIHEANLGALDSLEEV